MLSRYELHPDAARVVWDWWENRLTETQRPFMLQLLDLLEQKGLDAIKRRFCTSPDPADRNALNVVAEDLVIQIRPLRSNPITPEALPQCMVSITHYEPEDDGLD